MNYVALVLVAYLIGSVPFGLIVGKFRGGVDPRKYGSGSMGMTNVMRTMGVKTALLVFALDLSKGVAAVLLADRFVGGAIAESLAALAAIAGHIWPIFAKFRGGRGIALAVGALLTMNPLIGALALLTFGAVLAIKKYVSLASILAVGMASLCLIAFALALRRIDEGYLVYAVAGAALLIWRHQDNIKRLMAGREPKIGQRLSTSGPSGGARP